MLFVVDRERLQQMIRLIRSGKRGKGSSAKRRYLRFEAKENTLMVSGVDYEAEFSATVYEPGVLFMVAQDFEKLLATFRDEPTMAFQANAEGFMFGNVRFKFGGERLLLYPDPAQAPEFHPTER